MWHTTHCHHTHTLPVTVSSGNCGKCLACLDWWTTELFTKMLSMFMCRIFILYFTYGLFTIIRWKTLAPRSISKGHRSGWRLLQCFLSMSSFSWKGETRWTFSQILFFFTDIFITGSRAAQRLGLGPWSFGRSSWLLSQIEEVCGCGVSGLYIAGGVMGKCRDVAWLSQVPLLHNAGV